MIPQLEASISPSGSEYLLRCGMPLGLVTASLVSGEHKQELSLFGIAKPDTSIHVCIACSLTGSDEQRILIGELD